MATRQPETLTELVKERAGGEGKLTFVALSERCVDPESDYKPSANLLWKIASGQDVKVNPELVRAIAAGTGQPLVRVQAAAAYQYTGYVVTETDNGVMVHRPEVGEGDLSNSRRVLDRWSGEEHS
ncbi:hypothetical protein AB0K09_04145 [Streptomyces sp. NPDC049577]|uniref:hypothetical protein n=1 Tax=Streptomyces sp. NPDC049577 TaxID=3155153 RepID=UPI00341332BF